MRASFYQKTLISDFRGDITVSCTQSLKRKLAFGEFHGNLVILLWITIPVLSYLKQYHELGTLNTTRGDNLRDECKKIRNVAKITENAEFFAV